MSRLAAIRRGRSLGAKISEGRGRPWGIFFGFYKTRHILLSDSANCAVLRAVVLTQYRRMTAGQTDGIAVASTALAKRRAVKKTENRCAQRLHQPCPRNRCCHACQWIGYIRVRRSRGEKCILATAIRLGVCLSLTDFPHHCTVHGPGCNMGEWSSCALLGGFAIGARLHGFRCYDNSVEREMSASACRPTRAMPG